MSVRNRDVIVTTDSAVDALAMILGAALLTAAVILGMWFFTT